MPINSQCNAVSRSGKTMRRATVFLLLMCIFPFAAAEQETVYRSVEPDGTVTYSAWPPTDARKVEPVRIDTLSPEQRRAVESLREEEREENAAVSERMVKRERRLTGADESVTRAIERLNAAELALKQGRAPLPAERIGTAGGRSRLTEAYFERLSQLEKAIEDARAKLRQAYAERNALR